MSDKDNEIIIDEGTDGETSKEQEFSVDGLSEGELTLAKKHGFVKEQIDDKKEKENEHDEQTRIDTKSDKKDQEDKEDQKSKEELELPTFDQIEENEKLIDKYNRNEKALYWKWKTDKQKRQEAQGKIKELEKRLEDSFDVGMSGKKIEKIKRLLAEPDSLTIESLQNVLDEKIEPENKDTELDNAAVIQRKVATKAQFAEKIGSSKYDNFESISVLAKEVIDSDKSKTYQKLIDESFLNDDVDENMLVERVVNIARMSPKFNDVVNQVKPEDKEKVDRVLNNVKKKVSSASVSGASGKRIISESELTVEQATKLDANQWSKLKKETRERILKGINP